MTIVWSEPAKVSFINHMEYLIVKTPSGARRVASAIMQMIRLLENSPFMGRPGRWENTLNLSLISIPILLRTGSMWTSLKFCTFTTRGRIGLHN